MIKNHLVILDGNNTICALLPLLSLGKDTARLNPKLSTSPIARTTNIVGQTKKDNWKRLAKITQSYIKEFREDSILFIDKMDHKPTIHRSQQTHRKKKITSNRSPRERGRTLY